MQRRHFLATLILAAPPAGSRADAPDRVTAFERMDTDPRAVLAPVV